MYVMIFIFTLAATGQEQTISSTYSDYAQCDAAYHRVLTSIEHERYGKLKHYTLVAKPV